MKAKALIAAMLMFAAGALPAQAAPNPFHDAYQGNVTVTDVSVNYTDGILESHSDRAARSFVANDAFPAELRSAFETATANRAPTDETYAERLSEFLLARSIRAHTADLTGERRVRLEIEINDARINGMVSGALFGGAAFPRLGGVVRVLDADTGALLATATIINSQSWNAHNEAAEETHGFRYNFSGTDTNFRLLAGSTEAMKDSVVSLLRAPGFADRNEGAVVSTYPRIEVRPPVFNVTMAQR